MYMISIIIFIMICLLCLFLKYFIFKDIFVFNKIKTIEYLNKVFDNFIDNLINIFLSTKGTYDILINDTNISEVDYKKLVSFACEYIINNIPIKLKKQLLQYMTDDQFISIIVNKIDITLSSIYTTDGVDELKEE